MKKQRFDISQVLIFAALVVMVARYIGAFLASDMNRVDGLISEVLTGLIAVSGAGMGVLDVLGMAVVFDGWRHALPRLGARWSARFRILTAIVVLMFASGIMILVPFTMSRVLGQEMSVVLSTGWLWVWAIAVNLAPYLLIGGIMFSQTSVQIKAVPVIPPTTDVVVVNGDATLATLSEEQLLRLATPERRITDASSACACGYVAKNRFALSAHTRWCDQAKATAK
jgi:MFS family permease